MQNATNRYSEQDELSSKGHVQAENLGKDWANIRIDHLYSSTLERAVGTAHEIAKYNKGTLEIEQSEQLIEQHFGTTALQYAREGKISHWFEEVTGTNSLFGGAVDPDYRPSGGGESLSDVARRGRRFVEKEILGRFAVPLARSLDSFLDMKRDSDVNNLPEGIPHIVVVSHDTFLKELYRGIRCWNKKGDCLRVRWHNAGWCVQKCYSKAILIHDVRSRHILGYDAETKHLDFIDMVAP
jgi:broad specificity phosphatase PhoE